jgi:hypothetical protein
MGDLRYVVPLALQYYDDNKHKRHSFFKSIAEVEFKLKEKDLERNVAVFRDSEGKTIFESEYEMIGSYNSKHRIWTWAWSNPVFRRNSIYRVRKVLNYGFNLDLENAQMFLKTSLIMSRFKVSDAIQIDLLVALASYLAKTPVIYEYRVYPSEARFTEKGGLSKEAKKGKEYDLYYLYLLQDPVGEDT